MTAGAVQTSTLWVWPDGLMAGRWMPATGLTAVTAVTAVTAGAPARTVRRTDVADRNAIAPSIGR